MLTLIRCNYTICSFLPTFFCIYITVHCQLLVASSHKQDLTPPYHLLAIRQEKCFCY